MADVVSFPKPVDPELVWACSICECSTHRIYVDGTVECAQCGDRGAPPNGEWVKELPEPPAEPREFMPNTKVVSMGGSPRQVLNYLVKSADPETLAGVVIIQENGRVRTWGGISDPAKVGWLAARLEEARGLMSVCLPKSSPSPTPGDQDGEPGAA